MVLGDHNCILNIYNHNVMNTVVTYISSLILEQMCSRRGLLLRGYNFFLYGRVSVNGTNKIFVCHLNPGSLTYILHLCDISFVTIEC